MYPVTLPFHPLCEMVPAMSQEEYQALCDDIRAHGLLEPIWTWQGQIIDGRHRARACRQLGITPVYREWDGQGSLLLFVLRENVWRRHLNSSQKAMIALSAEAHFALEAARYQKAQGPRGTEGGRGHRKEPTLPTKMLDIEEKPVQRESAHRAGALLHVSGTYVREAKKIVTQAPELQSAVLAGHLDLRHAKTLARLPAEQRTSILHQIERGAHPNINAAILDLKKAERCARAQQAANKPQITCATWEAWLPDQPPCDLLLTDPPYSTEVEDIQAFARTWLPAALAKLKPTGRAYIFIGAYPQEIQAYLDVRLPAQLLCWSYRNTLGPSPRLEYKQNWQAILYYYGSAAPPLDCPLLTEQFSAQCINAPDGRQGERFHTWQKPDQLAEQLIRHSTRPDAVVLDCFAGTGTFLLAAQRLGRRAFGCDRAEEVVALAEQRGCQRAP